MSFLNTSSLFPKMLSLPKSVLTVQNSPYFQNVTIPNFQCLHFSKMSYFLKKNILTFDEKYFPSNVFKICLQNVSINVPAFQKCPQPWNKPNYCNVLFFQMSSHQIVVTKWPHFTFLFAKMSSFSMKWSSLFKKIWFFFTYKNCKSKLFWNCPNFAKNSWLSQKI